MGRLSSPFQKVAPLSAIYPGNSAAGLPLPCSLSSLFGGPSGGNLPAGGCALPDSLLYWDWQRNGGAALRRFPFLMV